MFVGGATFNVVSSKVGLNVGFDVAGLDVGVDVGFNVVGMDVGVKVGFRVVGFPVDGLEVGTFVDGFDDEGFDEGAKVVEHGGSTRQEKGLILPLYKLNECLCKRGTSTTFEVV